MRTSPVCNPLSFRVIPGLSVFSLSYGDRRVNWAVFICRLSASDSGLTPARLHLPSSSAFLCDGEVGVL